MDRQAEEGMTVICRRTDAKADHAAGAARLADAVRKFYEDPRNMEAYRKWMKEKGEKAG